MRRSLRERSTPVGCGPSASDCASRGGDLGEARVRDCTRNRARAHSGARILRRGGTSRVSAVGRTCRSPRRCQLPLLNATHPGRRSPAPTAEQPGVRRCIVDLVHRRVQPAAAGRCDAPRHRARRPRTERHGHGGGGLALPSSCLTRLLGQRSSRGDAIGLAAALPELNDAG